MSKARCFNEKKYDVTPFNELEMEKVCQELHEQGFQRHGWERMYNGATGLPLPALIFIGPCYYQRLKHMVDDKYHSRSTGITQTLTRQPTEGRSKEGGLRFGEVSSLCLAWNLFLFFCMFVTI